MKAADRKRTVVLGFEMGSGDPVEIPVRHTCITGQTQEAGKTTALEALIERSELKALVFVTKPGEASFEQAPRIRPYFKEDAQWRAVAAILEASEGQRLKFERPWIVRASQGARTLAEVAANVDDLLPKARGMNADVYLMLAEYLRVVVPVIAAHTWAPAVELRQGINVMDLGDLPLEMQHLVIKSSIEWVLKHGEGVIIVVPEAWKFLPQGRGTPVKLAAEGFIRQAAARGNFLWLDSQDIGGIEKTILRSIPVWILGVQREANEVARTLQNIPTIPKPRPTDIQLLELGQFFACWGARTVKTYVQPIWLKAEAAAAIARRGQSGADALAAPPAWRAKAARRLAAPPAKHPAIVDEWHEHTNPAIAEQLRRGTIRELPPPSPRSSSRPLPADAFVVGADTSRMFTASKRGAKPEVAPANPKGENEMNAAQEKKLDALVDAVGDLVKVIKAGPAAARPGSTAAQTMGTTANGSSSSAKTPAPAAPAAALPNVDELYRLFKTRLLADASTDPGILQILQQQPEIVVTVSRPRLTATGDELTGRLGLLILEGWFDEPKTGRMTETEMKKRGWAHDYRNIDKACRRLAAEGGFFRIDGSSYIATASGRERISEEGA